MASRSASREQATAQTEDPNAGAAAVASTTLQQMAGAANAASAMLRVADTFAQTQQHMIQRAALLQDQTADRLRNASSPLELLSIQSSLLMSSWNELAQFSQELMLAALKAQSELVRPGDVAAGASKAAAANPATAAASPLLQAWQAVFTAPLNGATGDLRH